MVRWGAGRPIVLGSTGDSRERAMDYEEFISIVRQAADVQDEEAARATRAVLQTIAERISKAEARGLVAQLPPELGPWALHRPRRPAIRRRRVPPPRGQA